MSKIKKEIKNEIDIEEILCPLKYMSNLFGGKWKLPIICILEYCEPVRYGQIKKRLGNITDIMLSQTLKELEKDNIIHRHQFNEVPLRVEYTLTQNGRTILPVLQEAAKWSIENMKKNELNPNCKKCLPDVKI